MTSDSLVWQMILVREEIVEGPPFFNMPAVIPQIPGALPLLTLLIVLANSCSFVGRVLTLLWSSSSKMNAAAADSSVEGQAGGRLRSPLWYSCQRDSLCSLSVHNSPVELRMRLDIVGHAWQMRRKLDYAFFILPSIWTDSASVSKSSALFWQSLRNCRLHSLSTVWYSVMSLFLVKERFCSTRLSVSLLTQFLLRRVTVPSVDTAASCKVSRKQSQSARPSVDSTSKRFWIAIE